MVETIIGLMFLGIGTLHFLWPKRSFNLRAKLYKKFYGAKVTGSKKTYKIYRIMGIAFIIIGAVFLLNSLSKENRSPEGVACTLDAKVCPDGSTVGRIPPNCEFAPCPGE